MFNHHRGDFVLVPDEQKEEKPTDNTTCLLARRGLNLGALTFGSVTEILQFYTGLDDLSALSDKLLGAIKPDPAANAVLTTIYALQAITINSTFTNEGIDTICRIMKGEKVPEWKELPSIDALKANTISIFLNGYGLFSDAAQTFYYLWQQAIERGIELNRATISGIISLSLLASASNIPTETLETHLFIRYLLSKKQENPAENEALVLNKTTAEKFADLLCIPLETVLKFFGALEDMIESYTTITAMLGALFGMTHPSVRWLLLSFSVINGFIDTMFNGKQSSDALELLKKTLLSGNYGVKEISAFLVSLFAASMVGQAQNSLIYQMLIKDVSLPAPLPTKIVEWLCQVFSTGAMAREIVNETYYFYPLVVAPLNAASRFIQGRNQRPSEFDVEYAPVEDGWLTVTAEEEVVLEEVPFDDSDYIFLNKTPLPEPSEPEKENTSCWANLFSREKPVPAIPVKTPQKIPTLTQP